MKIIDLLNKIANKEELPKKIKYNDDYWKVGIADNEEVDYLNDSEFELFSQYLQHALIESLNDEVEILEDEETDIQEIKEITETSTIDYSKNKEEMITAYKLIHICENKINEIIRVVNKIQQESKE